MIKKVMLINGIIEYDKKHKTCLPGLLLHESSPIRTRWKIIVLSFLIYLFGYELLNIFLEHPQIEDINYFSMYIFHIPWIADIAVLVTVIFYLSNIELRFQEINDSWKFLPAKLAPVFGECSQSEIIILVENIRLLHAELSEILKIFDLGYGLLLLVYFICNFFDLVFIFYLMIYHEFQAINFSLTKNILRYLTIYVLNILIIFIMLMIIVTASRINDKRTEIISYLRSYKISALSVDIKTQVKMFINQIPISQIDETNAFGFFSVNLNLIISILVLHMTGLFTLMQMKNHPIIMAIMNNTNLFH